MLELIQNAKNKNHLGRLIKLSEKSNSMVIVSPFLDEQFSSLTEHLTSIQSIDLYTTLERFGGTAQKILVLRHIQEYCTSKKIKLSFHIDEDLHGKVYLFYKDISPIGFLITSGNFTSNGLRHNHEFGLCVTDTALQNQVYQSVMNLNSYRLTEEQLQTLYPHAQEFLSSHPQATTEEFPVAQYINIKPSYSLQTERRFFVKPLGTSERPIKPGFVLKNHDTVGFTDNPYLHKGDILFCHGVGCSSLLGYYEVIDNTAFWKQYNEEDRWPWKYHVVCHSKIFSETWWETPIKTFHLAPSFKALNPQKHVTKAGGDTLGALMQGKDHLQITPEFAKYIIDQIPYL